MYRGAAPPRVIIGIVRKAFSGQHPLGEAVRRRRSIDGGQALDDLPEDRLFMRIIGRVRRKETDDKIFFILRRGNEADDPAAVKVEVDPDLLVPVIQRRRPSRRRCIRFPGRGYGHDWQ
jgi:hypothetical protein